MSPTNFRTALASLLQSQQYATQLGRDAWDFALEVTALRGLGLSNSDLRWLLCQGWVRHAEETTRPDADTRSFTPVGPLVLNDLCCFVLTPTGEATLRAGVSTPVPDYGNPGRTQADRTAEEMATPRWDKDRRLLRFGDQVVKQFKVPAPNQEIVLVAFQEEGWSIRIDDPLPMAPDIDPKRRLHDTINSLNRNQHVALLRFFGDGSGESVCWEPVANPAG